MSPARSAPRPDRIPCCVLFCRRTAPRSRFPDCAEIICGKHWRLASAALRKEQLAARRELDRYDALYDFDQGRFPSDEILHRACAAHDRAVALWDAIKAEVVGQAAGV